MQHSFEQLDARGGYARVGLLRPLRHRDFRLLWIGQTISAFGNMATFVAVPFQLYHLTGSALQVGLLSICDAVPLLLFASLSTSWSNLRMEQPKFRLLLHNGNT